MIDIGLLIDPDKIIKSLLINGHSGFKEKGNDVVCSGVSTLVKTFELSLVNKKVNCKIIDDNYYELNIIDYNEEVKSELKGLCLFLTLGLKAISKKYTDNIKLRIKE